MPCYFFLGGEPCDLPVPVLVALNGVYGPPAVQSDKIVFLLLTMTELINKYEWICTT